MADPFKSVSQRERGTVVRWSDELGLGIIQADAGDRVNLLRYVSILSGFSRIGRGQRVEFARMGYGQRPTTAAMVIPVDDEVGSKIA